MDDDDFKSDAESDRAEALRRPRSYKEYVREEILDATSKIIETEGLNAATPTRIFAATGIARSTIYRHWPNKVELIDHAFRRSKKRDRTRKPTPTSDVENLVLSSAAKFQNDQFVRMLVAMLGHAEAIDPEDEERWQKLARDFAHASAEGLRDYLDEARKSNTLNSELDTDELLAIALGPVLYLRLLHVRSVSDELVYYLARLMSSFIEEHEGRKAEES